MKYLLTILIIFSAIPVAYASATSPGEYFVSATRLNVRSAADKSGKVINRIYKGETVKVFEIKGDWARISPYFDDREKSDPAHTARWVSIEYLNKKHSVEKKGKNNHSAIVKAIRLSDNFTRYKNVFVAASKKLINKGDCKLTDFQKIGGWWRSSQQKAKSVYVTYCSGITKNNLIHLDVETGVTFK